MDNGLEWQKTRRTRFREQVLEQKLEISSIRYEAGFQETEKDRRRLAQATYSTTTVV
jgi:hypothetical protein